MPKIIIPEDFLCPITQELMTDPVATSDGQIYERKAIEQWLEKSDKSPLTNLQLKNKDLIAIPFVKKQIQAFFKQAKICTEKEFLAAFAIGDISKINQLNFLESYLEAKTERGDTPLHCAIERGSAELVEWLLNVEANVNAAGYLNMTPLHRSAAMGHVRITKLLLKAGAFVNAKAFEDQRTPLHVASFNGQPEIVALLLAANVIVDAMTDTNYTPLNMAIDQNHPDVVKLLLNAKANPNFRHKCKGDLKPLHCAALDGRYKIVELLVAAGADLEAKTDIGNTPLHCAVMNNHIETIQLLLDLNANFEIRNSVGNTPLESAEWFGYMKATECIQAHHEKLTIKLKVKQAIELNAQCINKFKQENYEEAIKISLKALQLLLDSNADVIHIAVCYYNLGSSYLKIYEKQDFSLKQPLLNEKKHLTVAIINLQKALSIYKTLNNAESIEKTADKIDLCFKYELMSQFTLTQKQVFRNRELKSIHVAVIRNDFSRVQEIYASNIKCLEVCDIHGWSPVVYALFFKASVELTSFLIEKSPQFLLQKKYSPLPFVTAHGMRKRYTKSYGINTNNKEDLMLCEYYTKTFGSIVDDEKDFDRLAHSDSKTSNFLDEDGYYPPIYFAFVHPKIVGNLIGKWSDTEFFIIIQLLISIMHEQLHLLKDIEEDDDCCALIKALACNLPEDIIKLLLKHTPSNVLEEKCVLVKALEQHYSKNVIELIIDKNPNSIKITDLGVPPLFAAIYSKAPVDIVELVLEQDTTTALKLTGATILGYHDDEDCEWVRGYDVTSLILALIFNRLDIAVYLLDRLPQLIEIKDENGRLPISYVDWKKAPMEFIKKLLVLSLSSLYKEESCNHLLENLLSNKRKEVVSLSLQLGFGIGANLRESVNGVDTTDCIVIGMSINGKPVTRKTPGFAQSITNLEELCFAQKQGSVLKTDKEFEYIIKLIQLMIMTIKQHTKKEALQHNGSNLANIQEANINLLVKFEKWLILNKPTSSLTHLCLRFVRNNYTVNEIKDKLPGNLFQKFSL